MKMVQKCGAFLLAAVLAVSVSGCTIPMPGFADYDVSGYIKAWLDSSYHAENDDYIALAGVTEEKAKENNATTIENAAVNFCNAYEIRPSDEELAELQKVMKQAFALSKYTVKDEQKADVGYYLEVEITPITNFSSRKTDIEKLKTEAQQEATAVNTTAPATVPGDEADNSEDEYGGDEEDDGLSSSAEPSSGTAAPPVGGDQTVDANSLFIKKVLEFCKRELANITYDKAVTISLDIRQTDQGELQVDTKQLDNVDKTVISFSTK